MQKTNFRKNFAALNKLQILLVASVLLVTTMSLNAQDPFIMVLGVAQDGGYPHLGCEKECCEAAWENPGLKRFVVSLALADPVEGKWFLFEATPDMTDQIRYFREISGGEYPYLPEAIFVSHAHIGHYTGLMELGREAMNASNVSVYALPRMADFLKKNGPWSQLVNLNNIKVIEHQPEKIINLDENISVCSFEVPHRDEYSETAGYRISTRNKSYLFIPDIDKWNKWERDISEELDAVDIAFIDGTFYSELELPGRNMSEIPHPFILETMDMFSKSSKEKKKKITFIHLNHSNPALSKTEVVEEIESSGFNVARQGAKY